MHLRLPYVYCALPAEKKDEKLKKDRTKSRAFLVDVPPGKNTEGRRKATSRGRRRRGTNYLQLQPRKRRSKISNKGTWAAKKRWSREDRAEVAEEVISLIIAERKEGEEINNEGQLSLQVPSWY